jgi:L-threonylcarbamoyladenylate synthase
VDLLLDGGELPGTPSTVIDLTRWEGDGDYSIVRQGALSAGDVAARLA